jgi:hypothetical protein
MSIFSSIAQVKPPRFVRDFIEATEADSRKIAASAEVVGAEAIGYAELCGLRYPVTAYHFKVSDGLTRGSRLDDAGLKDLAKQGFKGAGASPTRSPTGRSSACSCRTRSISCAGSIATSTAAASPGIRCNDAGRARGTNDYCR